MGVPPPSAESERAAPVPQPSTEGPRTEGKEGLRARKTRAHIKIARGLNKSPLDCKEIKAVNRKGNQP